jgi:tetratricopeptide (TPR) repeat protein
MTYDFSLRMLRNEPFRRATMALIGSALVFGIVLSTEATAQFSQTNATQRVLAEKPEADQAATLAEAVRKAWPSQKCSLASASLEKNYDKGDGGWLVICDGEYDYWVVVPATAKTTIVTPCALAWTADLNCYANLRTVAPEHIKACDSRFDRIDPVIRSCTVIIQSGRLTSRPDALAIAYETRGMAFGRYNQKDFALADFDEAVVLQPDNIDHRYNRAIALERKGKFDQAIEDLDKILAVKPDHLNASYERGYVFMQKANYDRAIDDFDKVLRVDPGFEKAVRQRAIAVQAKQAAKTGAGSPPKIPVSDARDPGSSNGEKAATGIDQKAAYCMEASFGFQQRETKFIQLVKQNQEKLRAIQGQTGLAESDRSKIQEGLKGLDDKIAQSESSRVKWDSNLKIFMGYLQRHGLLSQQSDSIKAMSAKAAADQIAVHETYRDCVRTCSTGGETCRTKCDGTAEASEASQRMKQCDRVAKDVR